MKVVVQSLRRRVDNWRRISIAGQWFISAWIASAAKALESVKMVFRIRSVT